MNYDEIFKEYCQKQNPNETISGGCAVFVLGFVDFLKQKAVEHAGAVDEGDSSADEPDINPWLLSHEEADRAAALRH